MTADAACRGSATATRGHDRARRRGARRALRPPPLSKALWKGKEEESVWRTGTADVELLLGRRVVSVDLDARCTATDDTGEAHSYEKLLLATGGSPRRLGTETTGSSTTELLETYRSSAGLQVRACGPR